MSLFFGKSEPERRAVSMDAWIRGLDGGTKTKSGVSVTASSAMQLGAVWSSVNLLASVVSNFPVDVFRGTGADKKPVSPVPTFVSGPSLTVSRREWVYQAMTSLLLRGNAYGYVVERDSQQRPRVVEWLNPDSVRAEQKSALHRVTYSVGGVPIPDANDIIHMRAFVQAGSAIGMSPIEWNAEQIGVGLAAQRYGAQWFGEGGHPSALFQNTKQTLDTEATAKIKDRFLAMITGRREPMVLGSDWTYTPLQVSASEAQFIESQGYTDAQVARMYGPGLAEVLGFATPGGSSLTYSNRVDRSLDLLTFTVAPWVNKFEDMWTANIAQPQTARMNTNSLLRSDNKARHEMYRIDREIGLYSIDELRALEDLPPLPDGQGADYTPLKIAKPTTDAASGGANGDQ